MKIVNFNNYTRDVDMSALDSYCHDHGRRVRYAKDEVFVQEGLVGKYMGFVEKGTSNTPHSLPLATKR